MNLKRPLHILRCPVYGSDPAAVREGALTSRAERIGRIRTELAPEGRGLLLLGAMEDRAARIPEYAGELDCWLESGRLLMLRRAAVPFGDFHDNPLFTEAVEELHAAMVRMLSGAQATAQAS